MAYTPPGKTRQKVLRFVRERLLAGAPPTVREVQRALRFRSVESARTHLEALVAEGLLAKLPGQARGYRLPGREQPAAPAVLIPLLGRVQAGELTTAVEDREDYLPAHSRLPQEDLFALRVRGESMTGVGIFPGDLVIVRREFSPRSGDIVVALVGDEATVKTFRRRGGKVILEAENPAFEALVPDPDELTLLGKVVEVRRYLDGTPLLEMPALED